MAVRRIDSQSAQHPKSAQEKPAKQCVHGPKASRDEHSDSDETYGQLLDNLVVTTHRTSSPSTLP